MRTAPGVIIRYIKLAWGFWLCLSLGCDGLPKLNPCLYSGGRKKTNLKGAVISMRGLWLHFHIKLGGLLSSLCCEPSSGLGYNVQGQAEASRLGMQEYHIHSGVTNMTSLSLSEAEAKDWGTPQSWSSESWCVFFKNLSFQQTLVSPEKSLALRLKLYNP